MIALTLPPDLEAWVRAEAAAGRGDSVEDVIVKAVASYRAQTEAAPDEWVDAGAAFAELKAHYMDKP